MTAHIFGFPLEESAMALGPAAVAGVTIVARSIVGRLKRRYASP